MEIIKKNNTQSKIVLVCFSIFIFFFDFLKDFFDFRLVILVPFLIAIYRNFLKKKNQLIIFFSILSFLLLIQGQNININLDDRLYNFYSVIFFIICSYTIWHYADLILKNIDLIFNFFLLFFSLYLFLFTLYFFDLLKQHKQCYVGCFSILNNSFEFFSENSHLGFVSISIISYLTLKIKKFDKTFFFTLLFYAFLLFNFSLTTFISLSLILTYFSIFYFKKYNFYQKTLIFFILLSSTYALSNNTSAIDKIYSLLKVDNWFIYQENYLENKNEIKENKFDNKLNNSDFKKDEKRINQSEQKNLSSEVYIVSLNIAKTSIFDKPLGYGLNNYHLAFKKYINNIYVSNQITKKLNIKDASNNLAKIITEFGFFGLIIFFIILNFLFSSNISYEEKFLIFPALFTQTFIRGAGYFNGGFIIFFILALYLIYKNKN